MRAALCAAVLSVLAAVPAVAGLECRGVFEFDDGALKARFRCHYRQDALRRARATCRDGEPGCDADGTCDGVCRFALCADPDCAETIHVGVPLRRHGKARGRASFRSGDTRVILRCLPSRGACGPTTTSPSTSSSTTTTTLPSHPCTGTLGGAVEASFDCSTSLSTGGLGLPVLTLRFAGADVEGTVAALLLVRTTGSHRLGQDIILAVADVTRPDLPLFQAIPGTTGASAEVRLDEVLGREAHGALDATLPSSFASEPLIVHADF